MKKILVVMNAGNTQFPSVDFAAYVANLNRSGLTAVFVENAVYKAKPAAKVLYSLPYVEEITEEAEQTEEQKKLLAQNVRLFTESCKRRYVKCLVHRDRGVAIDEVIKESRFADCMIVDASLSVNLDDDTMPSKFLEKLLYQAECPVLIAPVCFTDIDEIILTYNGTKSSVFAIKQFTYLFPQLEDKKITLMEIKDEGNESTITEASKLKELLMYHYDNVHYTILHGANPTDELFSNFLGKEKKLLVMGAFSKHKMLHKSTADLILRTLDLPLFIAHG